ncbi:hypothetical protein PGTUg99_019988 [Puccinia graminis f. sp. tritici]|uniref:Uncharacterized protein n=1 Tax=Puccinia graminis f. sp. tritici TaxID=56615 RepID=A0A5B0MSY3_PUCGR|nr:hypothetical protein PGTUg99_019988 [Puccinia graminis f. sp. tritici]
MDAVLAQTMTHYGGAPKPLYSKAAGSLSSTSPCTSDLSKDSGLMLMREFQGSAAMLE